MQPNSKYNPGGLGIIANDDYETVGDTDDCNWEKCAPGQGGVALVVEEIEEVA